MLIFVICGGVTSATDFFAGNYLVNYAIGRSGDGGNRTVSDDADAKLEEQKSADAGVYEPRKP